MQTTSPEPYDELQSRLLSVMRRLSPPWLANDVDDLVQAAQLKIFRRGDVVEELDSTFLYRVGHSVLVDEIRRRKRRQEVPVDTLDAPGEEVDPEAAASGRETGAVIHACLDSLGDDYRRAVTLRLQGHTVPEIGRLLHIKEKKAENLVYRGLQQLRSHLRKRGYP